MDEH
jgi:hypothetical protein